MTERVPAGDVSVEHHKDIEWFRPDPRRRLLVPWSLGAAVMTLGLCLTAFAFTRLGTDEALGLVALGGGIACVAAGMLTFVGAALRVLADDTCVGLRVDGLLFRRGGEVARLWPWEAVGEVRVGEGALLIEVDGGEVLRVADAFAALDAVAIAEKIRVTRRRALMGLPLRP
ncbi:MAG: hypothetical protein H6701_03090 [Myxococcales bacterium]|nr:hypothetical protein [Myxococcales bacterium]